MTSDDQREGNLASVATRGGAVTLLVQLLRFMVQLGGLVVLARLLSPAEFGIVAMAVSVVGVGEVFRDFGLSTAAIQARDLSHAQASNLFWLNFAIGIILSVTLGTSGFVLARLFDQPELVGVCAALAIQFIFSGAQTQFQAQLARQLRFGVLATTDLGAQTIGVVAGVCSALAGAGYWSLVIQIVVQQAALLAVRVIVTTWTPSRPSRESEIGELVRFGRNVALTQLLVYSTRSVDALLVGVRSGATTLGYYSRASQLLMLPLNQILAPMTSVALPTLSRIESRVQFTNYLVRAQLVVVYLTGFVFSVAAGSADDLVPIVFGSQWQDVSRLFQILSLAGIFQAASYVAYWCFIAQGLTGEHLRYSIVTRTLMVVVLVVGSYWGATGVAIGFTLATVVAWPAAWGWLQRTSDAEVGVVVRSALPPLLIAITAASTAVLVRLLTPVSLGHWTGLVLAVAAVSSTWLVAWAVWPAVRRDTRSILATAKLLKSSHG